MTDEALAPIGSLDQLEELKLTGAHQVIGEFIEVISGGNLLLMLIAGRNVAGYSAASKNSSYCKADRPGTNNQYTIALSDSRAIYPVHRHGQGFDQAGVAYIEP